MDKNKLPQAGIGLGLRKEIHKDILEHLQTENPLIKWLEIVPENYIDRGGYREKQSQEIIDTGIELIPHGVNLSIGTASDKPGKPSFDPYLIQELKKLFTKINPPWFSDHISCTRINGYYLQELIPLPRTKDAIETLVTNIKFLQDEFQIPFLIENPSFYSKLVKPEMPEADFINQVLEKADCGMLLDVNNIYVNSINHGEYSPEEFLNDLDLERVVQVHIAGHLEGYESWLSGKSIKILDTHGDKIKEEVFLILKKLLEKTSVNAILLERDGNFPEFTDLLKELEAIDEIVRATTRNSQLLSS